MEKWAFKQIIKYFLILRKENKDIKYKENDFDIFESEKKDITNTIIYAFLIGAIATFPIVYVEFILYKGESLFNDFDIIKFLIYLSVLVISVIIEFYLLYKIGFKITAVLIYKIYKLKQVGFIKINIKDKDFIFSLARSSLELDEPEKTIGDLNPYKYRQKNYLLITALYKSKVMITNFLLKILLKKTLARTGFRGFANFIAIPVTGIWDAFILNKIIKEVIFKLKVKIKIYEIINNIDKRYIEDYIKITALRFLYFGEYDNNIDFLLKELLKIKNVDISEKSILDYSNKTDFNFIQSCFITEVFSFKYKSFNKKEREWLRSKYLLDETKEKRKYF